MIPGGDDVSISNQHGDVSRLFVGTTHRGLAPQDPVVAKRKLMSLIRARPEVGGKRESLTGGKWPCCF